MYKQNREKLSDDEKLIYDDLYEKSKKLYPDIPMEEMYDVAISFYIKSGCRNDCFDELMKEKNVDINKEDINEVL